MSPETEPGEYVWSYLKTHPLANIALSEIDSLTHLTLCRSHKLQHRKSLLRSLVDHSSAFLRLRWDVIYTGTIVAWFVFT